MDHQLPRGNEGFPNANLFGDNPQFNQNYDSLFQHGVDQNFSDAGWGVHASGFQAPTRQNNSTPTWPQQHTNQLPTSHPGLNGQPSPYARPVSHSPAPYQPSSFSNYGSQNFQYRQPQQFDPSLIAPQAFEDFNYSSAAYPSTTSGTIAPQALQNNVRSPHFPTTSYEGQSFVTNVRTGKGFQSDAIDQNELVGAIPQGHNAGYFQIINFDSLAGATGTQRMSNFANIGPEAQNWDVNRAALPAYVPRKSRNELRKAAGNDPKVLAKLGKKIVKREKPSIIAPRSTSLTSTADVLAAGEKIKYEGESSSAEESSSDDDDSSYTSDDAAEPAPLPAKRPDSPKAATEYDTIKALWRSKRRSPNAESIRKGLQDFWEIMKTIRDRWKVDATAVTEAEEKKRVNELPLLRSRVKDQRDMIEVAFRVAIKHGHGDIVELFAGNASLMFLCYQFLLDRSKEEDYNGTLPRAILEVMARSTTLKEETYEKTHLAKVVPRFVKKGDAKTQFYAKKIVANVSPASTESTSTEPKSATSKARTAGSPADKRPAPEPVAGIKRTSSASTDGNVTKKPATSASRVNGTTTAASKLNGVKKASTSETPKSATGPSTVVKAKQVIAKPSSLFNLQSAAKKPGTSNASRAMSGAAGANLKPTATQPSAPKSTFSFTETMANLSKPKEEKPAAKPVQQNPNETPEEKAKRLRKESRRHLHVSFKNADELVQVRIFHHDPEEEIGHDASQVRDVGDVGGEGRMFKQQHSMMDIDEEEEAVEDEKLIVFKEPSETDFSDVDKEQRKLNYAKYGSGEAQVESAERAKREAYEANNLAVYYTDAKDIPPNPREPSDPYNGESVTIFQQIVAPEAKWAARGRQKITNASQQYGNAAPPPVTAPTMPDLSTYLGQHPFAAPNMQQPAPQTGNALQDLLANLTRSTQAQTATPPQPPMTGYQNPPQFQPSAPPMSTQQPAASGVPDLAAILAQITQNQGGAGPAPQMGGSAPNMMGFQPPMQQPGVYENPDRKQWRDDPSGANNLSRQKRQDPAHNPWYKTKICKYWQEGRCQKGDDCSYKHSED